eukprot:5967608-Amphidinium_carterae.1
MVCQLVGEEHARVAPPSLLKDLESGEVALDEFEVVWRLMSLLFPGALQDIFLGRAGTLQVTPTPPHSTGDP